MASVEAQVLAGRKAHRLTPKLADHIESFKTTLPAATESVGMAAHQTRYLSLLILLGNELLRSSASSRGLAMLAVLDGYLLAKALGPPTKTATAKTLGNQAAATRWVRTAMRSGPALLKSAHGDTVRSLIRSLVPGLQEADEQVMANGMACGALLFQYEYGPVPGLASLVPEKKTKSARVAVDARPPDALLDAVLAAPDDDAPRLVLADWLTERGDPLGEFIQIQCALGQRIFGADGRWVTPGKSKLPFESKEALEARQAELLKEHQKRWVEPIRGGVLQWGFRRGFVTEVISNFARFLSAESALLRVPLERARLGGLDRKVLPQVVKARAHPSLKVLVMNNNRLDDRLVAALDSPLLRAVRSLDLSSNDLGPACVKSLQSYSALRRLRLFQAQVDDALFAQLGQSVFWSELTGLDLIRCEGLTDASTATLARAPRLDWLRDTLPSRSDKSVRAIIEAHSKLKFLALSTTEVREATVLFALERLEHLEVLQLPDTISRRAKQAIAARFPNQQPTDAPELLM